MFINWQLRELNLKIVYYGPALSGKTTNLERVYAQVNPEWRSQLISLKIHGDRTLYFDFLQLEPGKINGLIPKLHLYTVPGQVYYEASRKLVLQGADGVVFVADSVANRIKDNQESWYTMQRQLAELNIPFDKLPLVVQFNKRDSPKALPIAYMRNLLRLNEVPVFAATAIKGWGVSETFKAIVNGVVSHAQRKIV